MRHKGIIKDIDRDTVVVKAEEIEACHQCRAKQLCQLENRNEVRLTAPSAAKKYHVGDEVDIIIKETLGILAVILAYAVPFILLITIIVTAVTLTDNEIFSGIAGLTAVGLYYFCLSLFKNHLAQNFPMTIEKR